MSELHIPTHPVRLVTASSLFDGHDASINIMRRIFMSQGARSSTSGHNRSVQEVVDAAIEEDVQGVAVVVLPGRPRRVLRVPRRVAPGSAAPATCSVVGGGGGVIVHDEIDRLRSSGVTIFSPEDGQRLGPAGDDQHDRRATRLRPVGPARRSPPTTVHRRRPGRDRAGDHRRRGRPPPTDDAGRAPQAAAAARRSRSLGITGTGGSGKSSLTDELVRRLRVDQQDKLRVAVRRGRPDPAQGRRRAARRPDPDELPSTATAPSSAAWPPAARTSCPTTSTT